MSDPLVACLFALSLTHAPQGCGIQPSPAMKVVERWGGWSCNKDATECRPGPQVPSVAHGE
jgi:hypothetical protein